MSQKLSSLLILLSVVAVVGAILIWQNLSSGVFILEELKLPQKTIEKLDEATLATWQTYQKEGFGFELKYPPSLAYKYDSVWTPDSSMIKKTLNVFFEGESFDLTLVLNAPSAQATTSKAELIRQKSVNIDGSAARNKIFREPNGDIISFVGFEKNANFYSVWASIIKDQDNGLKTFNQILSTFRFLP